MCRRRSLTLVNALLWIVLIGIPQTAADSYYVYVNWDPGIAYTTGINGYVDTSGLMGEVGAEYVFVVGGPSYTGDHTAYVYRVETAGDPNMHPDNPDATGPIAARTFTLHSSYELGYFRAGHENAFYVDDSGIYYGASPGWSGPPGPGWNGIFQWDHDWNPIGWVVTDTVSQAQTFARNATTGEWWVGDTNRGMWKWDGFSWVFQFTHPNLGGSHHDGMEIIENSIYISDMTSDVIIQYRLDDDGNLLDPPGSPYKTFTYSAGPHVEGMGYGPNGHIWISGWSSGTIYEIGGGELQISLEGIPDQCILTGEAFDTFDLDDYVAGVAPYVWTWSGNVNLTVNVDIDDVVTVGYPSDWCGEEAVVFTVTDSLGRSASDTATFTVACVPVSDDIPDQVAPFTDFDLDDYLVGPCPCDVDWTAVGNVCLQVAIDPATHVVTVTNPGDVCTDPETMTFCATAMACGLEVTDCDDATFTPMLPVAIDIKPTSCPNPLNHKSKGVLPVAILGTADLDVTQVDPASIRLSDVAPLRSSLEDVATPFEPFMGKQDCELDCNDYGPDGWEDLTLKFKKQEIVQAIGAVGGRECLVLTLTGNLKEEYGGMPIQGEDVVLFLHDEGGGGADVLALESIVGDGNSTDFIDLRQE